jgi:hypothetical protein
MKPIVKRPTDIPEYPLESGETNLLNSIGNIRPSEGQIM